MNTNMLYQPLAISEQLSLGVLWARCTQSALRMTKDPSHAQTAHLAVVKNLNISAVSLDQSKAPVCR